MRLETTVRRFGVIAAIVAFVGSPVYAGNSIDPGTPEITASYETIGFIIPYGGDDNEDAAVTVEFKPSAESVWTPIHRAARTPDRSGDGGPGAGSARGHRGGAWILRGGDHARRIPRGAPRFDARPRASRAASGADARRVIGHGF